MQLRDKTAYFRGLCYRWDPSLMRKPLPHFPRFMPLWCWDTPEEPVRCEDSGTCFKSSKSWALFEKKRVLWLFFSGLSFCCVANFAPISMKFWLQNWFFRPPYFIKKFILTNPSRVNDPPYFDPKTVKNGYFKKVISIGPLIWTKCAIFWPFLAPPADQVRFLWFKLAGTGVPHIVYVRPAPLGGIVGPKSQFCQK